MPPEPADADLVLKIAALARVEIADDEVPAFARRFAEIRALVDLVRDLDVVAGLDPATQAPVPIDRLRPDEPGETLERRALVENAPAHDGAFFVVPRFLEEA